MIIPIRSRTLFPYPAIEAAGEDAGAEWKENVSEEDYNKQEENSNEKDQNTICSSDGFYNGA